MSEIRNIEDFYENMALPEACVLGKRLFKKQFYEHGQLGAADKMAFVEDIERIDWVYTLKPSTINIPRLKDDTHEYLEIEVLQVMLSAIKRHSRIAAVIQNAIPYPLLIIFVRGNALVINAADKRINRADVNKIMIEGIYETGWIDTSSPTTEQDAFLSDFKVNSFSFHNLFEFYQDAVGRVIALNCAAYSGRYEPTRETAKSKTERLEALQQIEKFYQEQDEIRNKLKKEKNLGKRISLNIRIKRLSDSIEIISKNI